jgi:predicted nucleic acid-binding protein
MKYLFDTSIITELISTQPNPNLIAFVDSLDQADIYLSAITVGEIAKGIHLLPNSNRKRELDAWLRENLLVRFEGRILPLDADLFHSLGRILRQTRTSRSASHCGFRFSHRRHRVDAQNGAGDEQRRRLQQYRAGDRQPVVRAVRESHRSRTLRLLI